MIGRDNETNNEGLIKKCKLLAFMVYNYGFALEMFSRLKDAKASYKKGYEFSISMLGESSLYTNKFVHKIDSKRPIAISRSKTLNEKSNIRYRIEELRIYNEKILRMKKYQRKLKRALINFKPKSQVLQLIRKIAKCQQV